MHANDRCVVYKLLLKQSCVSGDRFKRLETQSVCAVLVVKNKSYRNEGLLIVLKHGVVRLSRLSTVKSKRSQIYHVEARCQVISCGHMTRVTQSTNINTP